MAGVPYNYIYKELVKEKDDAIGVFAYAIYKQQKIDFFEKIKASRNSEPTPAELENFHTISMLPQSIENYRHKAESLAEQFINTSLEKFIEDTENTFQDSAVAKKIDEVKIILNEKKTMSGWFSDVAGKLAVNFFTILIIGAVILGYNTLSGWNSKTEDVSGLSKQIKDKDIAPETQSNSATAPLATEPP